MITLDDLYMIYMCTVHVCTVVCCAEFDIFPLLEAINHAAEVWGIKCLRYEIRKFDFFYTAHV